MSSKSPRNWRLPPLPPTQPQADNAVKGLFIAATPIGNLRDITIRALDCLASVDIILCEDTRTSRKLLQAYGIPTQCEAYHAHNETAAIPKILKRLKGGECLALISDAGMPLISDPGGALVQACYTAGIPVTILPGASAVLHGLIASGFSAASFAFHGFFPRKKGEQREVLAEISGRNNTSGCNETSLFYESPKRVQNTLKIIAQELPQRPIAVLRELTKKFESRYVGTAQELLNMIPEEDYRGEVVLAISGLNNNENNRKSIDTDKLLQVLVNHDLPTKQIASIAQELTGAARKQLYNAAQSLKDNVS